MNFKSLKRKIEDIKADYLDKMNPAPYEVKTRLMMNEILEYLEKKAEHEE